MDETVTHEKPVKDDLYYLESVIFLVSCSRALVRSHWVIDIDTGRE